jgi:hypothetical protein
MATRWAVVMIIWTCTNNSFVLLVVKCHAVSIDDTDVHLTISPFGLLTVNNTKNGTGTLTFVAVIIVPSPVWAGKIIWLQICNHKERSEENQQY